MSLAPAATESPSLAQGATAHPAGMRRLTIRARLALLSGVLLLALVATTAVLTYAASDEAAGTIRAGELLGFVKRASSARLAFGEMRYWNADLAVTLLPQSEGNAAAARQRVQSELDVLAPARPQGVARIRTELAQYEDAARQAVAAYRSDNRSLANNPMIEARQHGMAIDALLAGIADELTGEAMAARDHIVGEAKTVTAVALVVVVTAVFGGALLTFFVLRSISTPLGQVVGAMEALNAGRLDIEVPPAGPDEIGAMAETLARFRDSQQELRAARDAAETALRELKTAQASLIHAEKMASLGQLTAGIAHEIKNPLNFVNNFAGLSVELLEELKQETAPGMAALDPDRRAEADEVLAMLTGNLEKISEHGRRADGIVRSMLLHSRGDSGARQSADINALAEEALNLAYHGARAQDPGFNIALERDFDSRLTPLDVVPQDITRVFINLFSNGFYAADRKRTQQSDAGFRPALRVATHDLGEAVQIRIRDNGIGMPAEIRDKLFQPFFTTKPTGEGTGLGLSISYDIVVQQHGGTITVDSSPGEYTEFTITLPRRAPGSAGTSAGEAA